jgi:RHS repeat-associated protein
VDNVWLYVPQERGVEWLEPAGGGWLELGTLAAGESRTVTARLRVGAMPRSGTLRFFIGATGDDAKPARERVDLLVPRASQETTTVPAAGGEVRFANGRVRLNFPPGWNEQDGQVTFQLEELTRQQRRQRGRLLLFTLTAAADGAPVVSFDTPVAGTMAVGDLRADEADEPLPAVSTAPTVDEAWTALEADFDPAAGTLSFTMTEPAAVQATTDPELWRLDYNPPGASAYNGAATYSYPIQLPPGIGGLTPDLTLSYSSRAAEGSPYPSMSQGFGLGWGLPQAQINNGSSGRIYNDDLGGSQGNTDFDKNAFTLVLNGMNYYMNPIDTTGRYGTYEAIGAPDLYVLYAADLNIPNVSGEYWLVRTADGTTYTFGRTEDAEQVIWPVEEARNASQPRNDRFSPYNWKLNSILDVHGNKVEYVYATACGREWDRDRDRGENRQDTGQFECSEIDTAVQEIRYNFSGSTAKTVVSFTNEAINVDVRRQEKSMTAGAFRPTQIAIVRDGQYDKPMAVYRFTYAGGSHAFSEWGVSTQFWMLTSIARAGSDGKTLPTQVFKYGREFNNSCYGGACALLLTEVDNGYGGVTLLGYQEYQDWQVVQYVETWDGVARKRGTDSKGQTRVEYDHTGATACFDTAGSGCHMGTQQPSKALVGFNKAAIRTQEWSGTIWKSLSATETDFINANHLLLGKVSAQRQLDPTTSVVLAKDEYTWQTVTSPDGDFVDDQLASETHTLNPGSAQLKSSIEYTYYPLNPAGGNYGALKTKLEKDEKGDAYRCTEYAYVSKASATVWLINQPERETVRSVNCSGSKQSETLYRYFPSAFPGDTSLDDRGLLTYVLHWVQKGMVDYYATEKREYHANGLPSVVMTFSGLSSTGAYTQDWRNKTTTAYNALGLPLTMTTEMKGSTTKQTDTLAYDTTLPWLVSKATDSNGIVTDYTYDGFGRLKKVIGPGDTTDQPTLRYDYYDNGALVLIKPLVIGIFYRNDLRSVERQFYDGLGRLVQTQTAAVEVQGKSKDQDVTVSVAYDARGLDVCRTAPYGEDAYVYNGQTPFRSAACTTKPRTTTTYDALGRVTNVKAPDDTTTRMVYEVATNITVGEHNRFLRTLAYDGNNNLTVRLSDVFGRQVLVREFTASGAYADTRYGYGVRDELVTVTTSEASDNQSKPTLRETLITYDQLGRKIGMTDPDMGMWWYNYDDAGNLNWQMDGANKVICFYYDNLNRLLRRVSNGTSTTCPAYGSGNASGAAHLASYTYGGAGNLGRLMAVSWGPSPVTNNDAFTYDGQGRLKTQTRTVNGHEFDYEVTLYDALDRPKEVLYPDDNLLVTTYDQEGVDALSYDGQPVLSDMAYTALGQPAKLDRAGSMADTTYEYYEPDENSRLKSIQHGAAFPGFTFTSYDGVGNLTGRTVWGNAYTYGYDALNRLTTVRGNLSQDYTYDRLGNFDTVTKWGEAWDYSYRAGTSRVDKVTVLGFDVDDTAGYDARGNLTKYAQGNVTTTLAYDVEGRLTSATTKQGTQAAKTTEFFYDANGNRVRALYPDGGGDIYTPFPDVEKAIVGGVTTWRITFSAGGQLVAQRQQVVDGATKLFSLHTDHLGSVVAVGNAGGGLETGSYALYEPFGAFLVPPTATNPSVTDRGFTGHKHNNLAPAWLGLVYMNARYYHPQLGRFVSPDSIVPNPANPQSYNRYSYVRNSPLNFTDPTGHKECVDFDINGCSVTLPHQSTHRSSSQENSSVPTPQLDLTEWLAQEMVSNLNDPNLQWVRLMMQTYNVNRLHFALGLWRFYILNSNNGVWNIKLRIDEELGKAVTLCGIDTCAWVDYSTPGNIHFGYVTAYSMIPLPVALVAGGLAESWDRYQDEIVPAMNPEWLETLYDNPDDFTAVLFGYFLYQKYGPTLTLAQLKSELTIDVLDSFQAPTSSIQLGPAVPQPNTYPPGAFDND